MDLGIRGHSRGRRRIDRARIQFAPRLAAEGVVAICSRDRVWLEAAAGNGRT
jgi:hypothetical protein